MSSGTSGSDEKISGSKIDPLASETKFNIPLDTSSRGVVGTDRTIDQARINPIGGKGQYQHPALHATSGVTGDDVNIDKSKIEPLDQQAGADKGHANSAGLGDEAIDAARVQPLGAVREQLS